MLSNDALRIWLGKRSRGVIAAAMSAVLLAGGGDVWGQDNFDTVNQAVLTAAAKVTPGQIERYLQEQGDYHLLYVIDSMPINALVRDERLVVELQIQFKDYLARARQAAVTNQGLASELQRLAIEKFGDVVKQYERLIKTYGDSPRLPIWQTNLAELYLQHQLQLVNQFAAESFCFGIPSREQEAVFGESVRKAFSLLAQADAKLYKLQTTLPRSKDYAALNTQGLPTLLFDEYSVKRTPYYLAVAATYIAALPSDDVYYTGDYDRTNAVTVRADSPEKERVRLLNFALRKFDPFISDQGDVAGVRFAAILHASHALLMQKQYAAAIKLLQPIQSSERQDMLMLSSYLVRAYALAASSDVNVALGELRRLASNHPIVKQSLVVRLLVTDAMFKVKEQAAAKLAGDDKVAAINDAFEVYYDLLSDKSVSEQEQKSIQYMVAQRFERLMQLVPDARVLPERVRLTITDYALQQAQLMIAANKMNARSEECKRFLKMVAELAKSLDETEVEPGIRAQALYNAAVALYLPDPNTLENQQHVAILLTDVARKFPQQAISLKAITFATQTLQQLHQRYPNVNRMVDDYAAAAEVLFNSFSVSPAADNQRVYYAFYLLQAGGQYNLASAHYKQVPFDHVQYFDAQRELLFCLDAQLGEGEDAKRYKALSRDLDANAKRIIREVTETLSRAEADGDEQRVAKAKLAQATAQLLLAVNAERNGEHGAALTVIDSSEIDFNDYPQLLPRVLQLRIGALIGEGRLADAALLAKSFMSSNPDIAVSTIERLLLELDVQFKNTLHPLHGVEVTELMIQKAQAALTLVEAVKVANRDGHVHPELKDDYFVAMEMIASRAYQIVGRADDAVKLLQTRLDAYGDQLELVVAYAEANYALDTDAGYEAVREYYQMVIGAFGSGPFEAVYYQAWLRYLQACDLQQYQTEDIPLYIRRLRMKEPGLGGAAYLRAFDALEEKYSQ